MRIKMFIDKKNIQIVQNTVKKWKNQSLVSKKYQKYIVENSSTSSCRSIFGLRASCSSAQVAVLYTTSSASSSTSKYVEESEDLELGWTSATTRSRAGLGGGTGRGGRGLLGLAPRAA
jgi:K+/H+ antiporter YhaU regulatory subunit KhtT